MSEPVAEIPLMRFDWAIKTLLRDKANFDVLEGFLGALLEETVTIEQILEGESNAQEGRKYNRVDLLVHDSQGRKLIIEVQNQREADYLERLLFGTAKVIVENLPLGEAYREVVKVISISILYFNLGAGDDYVYYGMTEFKGIHTGHLLTVRQRVEVPGVTFSYQSKNVFPEYYLINVERFQDIIQVPLDEWIYLLKHSAVRADFRARHIDKAAQKLALMRMDPEERRRYERYLESLAIERDVIETAKQEGRQEGRQEVLEAGRQKGEAAVLLRQLERKFGPLTPAVRQQVAEAGTPTLLRWSEQILTADTVDAVFQ